MLKLVVSVLKNGLPLVKMNDFDRKYKVMNPNNRFTKTLAVMLLSLLGMVNVHATVKINYVISDYLGTPQMLIDQNRNVVWQADYDEFGKATLLVEQVEFNQRLPGQYYDKETELNYNYYRDYDPSLGRYVQSDPIGLAGGINTYGYVGGNPVSYVDPTGLIRWSGSYLLRSVMLPLGAQMGWFELESDCINDLKARVSVFYSGSGGGVGPKLLVGAETSGNISFEDHEQTVRPWVFQGGAGIFSLGATIGNINAGIGKIVLGSAYSRESSAKGIDIGMSMTGGYSTLTNSEIISCDCKD